MKATLKISSDGSFLICLFPETKSEQDILKRAAEQRELTCFYHDESFGEKEKYLSIAPIKKAEEK